VVGFGVCFVIDMVAVGWSVEVIGVGDSGVAGGRSAGVIIGA
jgi:hypothetical protein